MNLFLFIKEWIKFSKHNDVMTFIYILYEKLMKPSTIGSIEWNVFVKWFSLAPNVSMRVDRHWFIKTLTKWV